MRYQLPQILPLCMITIPLIVGPPPVQSPDLDRQILDAAAKEDLAAVADLLARGVDVNADNGFGITPLYIAADRGNLELVKLLLQNGADPNRSSLIWGKTPLRVAAVPWSDVIASEARSEIVKLLVDKGAGTAGEALVDLIRGGYLESVQRIVSQGGVNTSYLNLALEAAERAGHVELAEWLKNAGAKDPGPLDSPRSAERLKALAGVYRSEAGNELVLSSGLEEGELFLERAGSPRVALTPADLTLLRSRDRKVVVRMESSSLPPTRLTLSDGRQTEAFTRTDKATTTATAPTPRRRDRREPRAVPRHSHDLTNDAVTMEWPSFRGTRGSGVADSAHPPTVWDLEKTTNVKWKTPIPGFGHSSPIVWGDRVFVTTAVPSSEASLTFRHGEQVQGAGATAFTRDDVPHSWRVYALDRHSGNILWEQEADKGIPRTARHVMASQANQTPATDGTYLIVWFGSQGVYCYDMHGKLLWKRDLGTLRSGRYFDPGYEWNTASSPVIYNKLVFLQVDLLEKSYIAAVDIATGKEVWHSERDELPSWSTPLIYEGPERIELVTVAPRFVRGYNPNTGEELWRLAINTDFPTPTPIAGSGLVFVTSGYGTTQPIIAILPGAKGDISLADDEDSNADVAWSARRGGSVIPTPIVYRGLLYVCSGTGILSAYQAESGERVFRARLTQGGNYSASPVAAGGRLYFATEEGEVVVVKAGREFEQLAVNHMGELIMATPAVSHDMMIFRLRHNVVAVAEAAP